MTTLQWVELGVLGPLQVRQYGLPVTIPGAKPRAILTLLGLRGGAVLSAEALADLLWGDDPPHTAAKALQTHISALRRALGDGFVLTEGTGWSLGTTDIDATRYQLAAKLGRDAAAAGDPTEAMAHFDEALTLWRGIPELPDGRRGAAEKTRWVESHAALVEDRADALLATGRAAEIIGELEAAIADAPLRERRWGHLILALYRAGRQGEALGAYQRARTLLAEELGIDPGPDLRRLEAAVATQDEALEVPVVQHLSPATRAVTFLLTDIEGSTAAWEKDADAMAAALARHDEIVEQVVTSRGGRLVKTRGEGDATFSVFDRPSAAAAAAIELQEAMRHEPWALAEPLRIRVALHTGEVELRNGDYFGRAVNRAARLRSLAAGDQILCSGATAELVIDTLSDDVVLTDLGMRVLKNLARPEHVFELRLEAADDFDSPGADAPMSRPDLPAVLCGPGPFVGRERELGQLLSAWQAMLSAGAHAVLIAGEPGVGKTRLAGEWSRQAYDQGAVVLYGRCDEDLVAPYQPFAEALRSLVPCLGAERLRGLRGVEALLPLVPGLTEVLPDLAAPPRADPDTERYALFDAVVAVLEIASPAAAVVLILDDLHWAAKPTLLLLRHVLRFGDHARVQIIGTYRSTDLDRSHPLAAMLADLHRDGSASRLALGGLDEHDVSAYVVGAGYDDEELARALASVTGGNPFFLIEALRHVDESGGHWDPSTLPQGVREAVSRRLSRLPAETNKALAAAAVVGSRFALELVEQVVGTDLVDAFDEASQAGILIEETGGRYRFNHALVRQSLLAELASVRRMRLHQRIAAELENRPGADDELLAELAYHYFECAWAGNAVKAVDYCRRAADQALERLAYEGAADLYDRALHALEELDDDLPDRHDLQAELLIARCEALLAAGDVVSAGGAVTQLIRAAGDSVRLTAWGTCFEGELSSLTDPERLDEIASEVGAAAETLAGLEDAAGEAKAHTVRASCLGRLGRVADCESALDQALTAARRAGDHHRVNAVLAWAPLAALWGPNPVPRAGGRCLDVVRLLRITTGSPVVEATSTRCQAVLDAFRGRAAAGRQLIDSARRSLTELGMRHALLEVDQFAGVIELVADDPASAEAHLRRAYQGFRRMGLEADTAETAALLARACLALGRGAEADELCSESERLAGDALKASMTWRTVRAQLLSRRGAHDEARQVAEEAVALAARTDALVDHGDACLALATVLRAAGDAPGARAAAEQAVELYERKGAAALTEKARVMLGEPVSPAAPSAAETAVVGPDHPWAQLANKMISAYNGADWDQVEQLLAPTVVTESHRKIVGYRRIELTSREWVQATVPYFDAGMVRLRSTLVAVRSDRLALVRLSVASADGSPGAPQDEFLRVGCLDESGRIALEVAFDLEDIDAALTELDAQHARLEQERPLPPISGLENACTDAIRRLADTVGRADWDEFSRIFAEDVFVESRRKIVGWTQADLPSRDWPREAQRFLQANGSYEMTPIAVRGQRVALLRLQEGTADTSPGAPRDESLMLVGLNDEGRIALQLAYDVDDIAAAIAELDAQQARIEERLPRAPIENAASQADARICALFAERRWNEIGTLLTAGLHVEDRRQGLRRDTNDGATELLEMRTIADLGVKTITSETIAVRGDHLALVRSRFAGRDGLPGAFHTEILRLTEVDDQAKVLASTVFDVTDLDAALAELEAAYARITEQHPRVRLENAASRLDAWFNSMFAERRWDQIAAGMADEMRIEDRRHVLRREGNYDRTAVVAEVRSMAEIGVKRLTSCVIAIRGERLTLCRTRYSGGDQRPAAYHTELLRILEIDADEKFSASVAFDVDDVDAAFTELEARYLAGAAKPYARTWSVITSAYAAFNRQQLAATTPDNVTVDHRRGAGFAPGEMTDYLSAAWEDSPGTRIWIEAVHRLTALGAVVTHGARGTSRTGFEAEWRDVGLLTVDDDLVSRYELFDETDLAAALSIFDELSCPAKRLENTATRVSDRINELLVDGHFDAIVEMFVDDLRSEDRRHGLRRDNGDRATEIANLRAVADLGLVNLLTTTLAVRGTQLCLNRVVIHGRDGFGAECLAIAEVEDGSIVTLVAFDPEDLDGAFAELDALYLAGEAVAHAHTWSVIAAANAAFNRHEMPATTPDWASIDHRRVIAFTPDEMGAYIRATWDVAPGIRNQIAEVHRLSDIGAVFTQTVHGISQEGFEAEWRDVALLIVEGDLLDRIEAFDEADLDAALARFDELGRRESLLENTASRVGEALIASFVGRNWAAMAAILADDFYGDDRRQLINVDLHGRDAVIESFRAAADLGFPGASSIPIATRAERLALSSIRYSMSDADPDAFRISLLQVTEIGCDDRITGLFIFDPGDIDAAFAELDARYLAGEAKPHAHVAQGLIEAVKELNRHEPGPIVTTTTYVDHRRVSFGSDFNPAVEDLWALVPDARYRMTAVHTLDAHGGVASIVIDGTDANGNELQWAFIIAATTDDRRVDLYEEDDLDTALARFEELRRSAPRLENAASRMLKRYNAYFMAHDWDAMAEMVAEDICHDDRRRVANSGIRHGRDAVTANMRAVASVGVKNIELSVIAIRGDRLSLCRSRVSGDKRPEAFGFEILIVIEVDSDGRFVAGIVFDPDNLDAAFTELDTRYAAGEAAAHAQVWSVVSGVYNTFNQHELPATTPDLVTVDHRPLITVGSSDMAATIRAVMDELPNLVIRVETVHRLTNLGAVITHAAHGASQGFDAQWRMIFLYTVQGDQISRYELFDETGLDAALDRFDELTAAGS